MMTEKCKKCGKVIIPAVLIPMVLDICKCKNPVPMGGDE